MAEEEAQETPPEPVPPLSEEDLENRQTCFDEIFAGFAALEVKQKSMRERSEKEAPPPNEEGEEGVEQAPETTPNIALAYSELSFSIVNQLINLVKEKCGPLFPSKGIFLDFGSGAGKTCIAAGLIHPFEKVVGIETLQCLADVEAAAQGKYAEAALPEGVPKPEMNFIKGCFVTEFDTHLEAIAPEVAVAIVVATTFGEPEMQAVTKLAQKMPEGSSLIMITQMLEEFLVVDVNRDPRKRRAAATKKALARRGVEPEGIEIVLEPAENDPNGWRLKHSQDLELEWGTTTCYIYKKYTYPYCDEGDLCMATRLPEENDPETYPAYYAGSRVDAERPEGEQRIMSVRWMDCGLGVPCDVGKVDVFSEEDRKKAIKMYTQKVELCKECLKTASAPAAAEAFEQIKSQMGETFPEDGKIGYKVDQVSEAALLVKTLIDKCGGPAADPKVANFMSSKFVEACIEADTESTGMLSEAEAASTFDKVKQDVVSFMESKLAELQA